MKTILSFTLLLLLSFTGISQNKKPKLILQITVDQLRGDLPFKYSKNMGEGGFRFLMKNGIWFTNAHYSHANTETVVGHTVLATGADPSVNGMIANVWFDREKGKLVYNIEDEDYKILSANADVDKSTELDASQALATTEGRSPKNIIVTTFSDELLLKTNGKSKIFGVSIKDRGAVTLAGHVGKAFWFSKSNGEFITSNYYYEKYPEWVKNWNKTKMLSKTYSGKAWELMNDKSPYMYGMEDNMPWETNVAGFGIIFPHEYKTTDNKYFTNFLTYSPAGDEITLDFAKTLIKNEKIGKDEITDFLAISFSSTDYVGHLFGPSSLEAEDNMLRLDKTLANLFTFIDKEVGLENTLIILSADHGGPEVPGYLNFKGIESGYVSPGKWDKEPAIETLKKRFGIGQELIQKYFPPYLYLNETIIAEKGLNLEEVEKAVAIELMKIKGVALAVSSYSLQKNELPDTYLNRKALRNFNITRSGNLLVIFQPQYAINDYMGEKTSANHGGSWMYDSYVPVVFAGMNIKGQKVSRKIEPKDVASTLANFLETKPPSGANGEVLIEVIEQLRQPK
jgi:predicted AlkP superfamily pyrophosphatase or phosphodiesterase